MLNSVQLIGRLGADPEIRYTTASGTAVCNFTMATSERWKDKETGEKTEKTEWHRIVCFGKLAEICVEYLSKGKLVYIEGKLQTRMWEKDDHKNYTTEIVAGQMLMLSGSGSGDGKDKKVEQQEQAAQYPDKQKYDDDIPF